MSTFLDPAGYMALTRADRRRVDDWLTSHGIQTRNCVRIERDGTIVTVDDPPRLTADKRDIAYHRTPTTGPLPQLDATTTTPTEDTDA